MDERSKGRTSRPGEDYARRLDSSQVNPVASALAFRPPPLIGWVAHKGRRKCTCEISRDAQIHTLQR